MPALYDVYMGGQDLDLDQESGEYKDCGLLKVVSAWKVVNFERWATWMVNVGMEGGR